MTTTTGATAGVRSALACLHDWLTRHPGIPVASVDYVDHLCAELSPPPDDVLRAAAEAADSLTHAVITITAPHGMEWADVTVDGVLAGDDVSLRIDLDGRVYDEVRDRLLSSLYAPPDPGDRRWSVTADHLRGVVETAHAAGSA